MATQTKSQTPLRSGSAPLFQPRKTALTLAVRSVLGGVLGSTLLTGFISPAFAAAGDVAGVEFLVNTHTEVSQRNPSIAMDADGDFVVSWQSYQDGSGTGVYAQRYNADGVAAGAEFLVNTYTTSSQFNPSIAMDADGDFVVSWQSSGQDGDGNGVYAQRYNADGVVAGAEFLVNTTTASDQAEPSIAMDADGDFVVSWQSSGQDGNFYGVYAQRYSADGVAAGAEFLVNTTTVNSQGDPSIAMDADGDFVVSWQSFNQDGEADGVYAQRYNADGLAAGAEFLVNTHTASAQRNSSIAMDADGDFVVSWVSFLQDGSSWGVYAQRYNADGVEADAEFLVNTTTANAQVNPSIAMDADGDFVVSWVSSDGDGNGVYARRYSADGVAADAEFLVNTHTTSAQRDPSIAMDADGDFVVSWHSLDQDGGDYGVYAQRYQGAAQTVDLNLVVNDDSDPVTQGTNFIYSLISSNNGTGIAMDVNLSEPLPAGITYVSDDAASTGWICAQAATTLECNLPLMNPGASNTINVTVTASAVGTTSNVVTLSAAQTDSNPADNTDTETTEIVASDSGGGGSLSWFISLLLLPLALRRKIFSH